MICLVGARPVFVDLDPASYTKDLEKLKNAITKHTKAIIAVSLYGQMPPPESINFMADRWGFAVIEDATQSFGATRNGRPSCGASLIGSISFFPSKPLGCFGDGGALFTDKDELADSMRAIRIHGSMRPHDHTHLGMNGCFGTLQAVILLGKWPHFESEIELRQRIGGHYSALLREHCVIPQVISGNSQIAALPRFYYSQSRKTYWPQY